MSVLAVFGPTASGKTAVAEAVADRIPAEIVSADSMQVYRGLPILTNQPDRPTHLVGVWELDHEASVGEYEELAHAAIDEVLELAKTPIVVGGTGLYLRAALAELDLPPAPAPGERNRWEAFYDAEGAGERARAACRPRPRGCRRRPSERPAPGRPCSRARGGRPLARAGTGPALDGDTRHPTLIFGFELPPEELERRIVARTAAMFEAGVQDEVRQALAHPISQTARQAHGARGGRDPPRGRGERTARAADSSLRRVPAKVDAAHTRALLA